MMTRLVLACLVVGCRSAAPAASPSPKPAKDPPKFDVRAYGAKGDGTTDDRAAIMAALKAAAAAGGGVVYFPPGTYVAAPAPGQTFSLDLPCNNCTLLGVRGKSWLMHPAGMPKRQIALLRIDDKSNVTIRDLGFDGNWGNKVGGTDSAAGIHHASQADPKNQLLMLRGAQHVTIEHADFRQAYGDCIWMGFSSHDANAWTRDVKIIDTTCDMAARDGIAIGQATDGVLVDHCKLTNIFAQAFDTEPVNQPVRDVTIQHSYLDTWWDPADPHRAGNSPLSIVGGNEDAGQALYARHYRVLDNVIHGAVMIASAADVVLEGNRILADWPGFSYPTVNVYEGAEDVTIANNDIYTRTTYSNHTPSAAVAIHFYAAGKQTWQPSSVRVEHNRIHAHAGDTGILVNGAGGPCRPPAAGVAHEVTERTLVDPGQAWQPGWWIGATVKLGGAVAIVRGNTADTLQLGAARFGTKTAWTTPTGEPTATPAAGAYTLGWPGGTIEVVDNTIDLSDDGAGAGGHGILVGADRAGTRVRVRGNTIVNATGDAIHVKATDQPRAYETLEIVDNTAYDAHGAQPTTAMIGFDGPRFVKRLVMSGNAAGGGITAVRALGKGWRDLAATATASPAWLATKQLAGASGDPASDAATVHTLVPDQVERVRVRCYGAQISKLVLDVAAPATGGTLHVGLDGLDGTPAPAMAAAGVDATAAVRTPGLVAIALPHPVSVQPGEYLYVELRYGGPAKAAPALRGSAAGAWVGLR